MEKRINIASLLKDCPKGTKLYSPVFPCKEGEQYNCKFEKIDHSTITRPIVVRCIDNDYIYSFLDFGDWVIGGECLLYPSKEVRDWGLFKTKYVRGNSKQPAKILELLINNGCKDTNNMGCANENAIYFIDSITHKLYIAVDNNEKEYILTTGSKLKLEEKEQPKFKVGDVVLDPDDTFFCIIESVGDVTNFTRDIANVLREKEDYFLATPKEIKQWNEEVLQPKHLHYSTSKRKIIHWFNSTDDVVVRSAPQNKEWRLARFSHYSHINIGGKYCADSHFWHECLPYNEETSKLIGTTNDYKEE